MNDKYFITKREVLKLAEKYGLQITDRMLNHYKNLGLIENPAINFYKSDTAKTLYTIERLKKLGVRLKLKEIKFHLDLLKLGKKEFEQIKNLKDEKKFINSYKEHIGITEKRLEELKKLYPVMYCEILIDRYFIFEHCLEYRAYIEIFDLVKKLKENKTKEEKLIIDSVWDNPGDPEINLEKEEIIIRFDEPIYRNILFKRSEIRIIK